MANAAEMDNEASLRKEQWAYGFESFARGPAVGIAGVWVPVVIYLASLDSVCTPFAGQPSGADGMACSDDTVWNQKLWLESNGAACEVLDSLGAAKYTHDASLPGCPAALAAYREATAYTCNCTGDYAVLPSGIRAVNVTTLASGVGAILSLFLTPLFGTMLDIQGKRKHRWKLLNVLAAVCVLGIAALARGSIWIISIVFQTAATFLAVLIYTLKSSYMEDLAKDDPTAAKLGGQAMAWLFAAQAIFLVVAGVLTFIVGDMLAVIISTLIYSVWSFVCEWIAISYFRERPAKPEPPEGTSILSRTTKQLVNNLSKLRSNYPEAAKYLLFTIISSAGTIAFLQILTVFTTQHLKLSPIMNLLILAAIIVLGAPFSLLFYLAGRWFKLKHILIFTMALWTATLIGTTLIKEGDVVGVFICVVPMSLCFSWYFAIGWAAFICMVPKGTEASFAGLWILAGAIGSSISPVILLAVIEQTNDVRYGLWILAGCCLLSLVLLCFINFEKGRRDAEASVKVKPIQKDEESGDGTVPEK